MQHSIQVLVDGESYVLTHLAPTKAFGILTKLIRFAGSALGKGFEVKDLTSLQSVDDVDIKISELIGALSENLDSPEANKLVMDLIGSISHDGKMLTGAYFETHFLGKVSTIFKLLIEQVKFQYADFFTAVAGIAGGLATKVSASLKRQKSNGQSGASSSQKSPLSRKLTPSGV